MPSTFAWKNASAAPSLRVTWVSAAKCTIRAGRSSAHQLGELGGGDVHAHRLDQPRRDGGQAALVAGVGVRVDVQHRDAVGRERADERRADEAQAAGDEHAAAHAAAPRLCSAAASSIAGSAYGSSAAWAWARKRAASSPS